MSLLHLVAQIGWYRGPDRASTWRGCEVAVTLTKRHVARAWRTGNCFRPSSEIGIVLVKEVLRIHCRLVSIDVLVAELGCVELS